MRAPNSRRSLNAPSSSFVVVSSFVVLLIFLAGPIPVSTRSVTSYHNQKSAVRINDDKLSFHRNDGASFEPGKNEEKLEDHSASSHEISRRDGIGEASIINDKKSSSQANEANSPKDVSGKSSIISEYESVKGVEESAKPEQEGIRRFDAVVASEDNVGKASSSDSEKPQHNPEEKPKIAKTVTKGIFVRDGPVDAGIVKDTYLSHGVVETSEFNQHRKRSLNVADSTAIAAESSKVNLESSSGNAKSDSSSPVARDGLVVDSIESRQVPVLIPVGSSYPTTHHKVSKNVESPLSEPIASESGKQVAIEESSKERVIQKTKFQIDDRVREIPELIQPHEEPVVPMGDIDVSEIVLPATKTIVINSNGLGNVAEQAIESPEEENNARKSLLIAEENDENDEDDEDIETKIENDQIKDETSKPLKNDESSDYKTTTLERIVKSNVSLKDLKLQALSLQRDIKDKTLLQRLKEQATQVLPDIPKFDENELLEALDIVSSSKKMSEGDAEYSYLSKMDTSLLSERQLKILKCAEALVVREQRQTFGENIIECIRGLNILNCMRIFVWPIIADNIPAALSQNLPTLPIEVNVMDWLPGNQQDIPKSTRLRSAVISEQHKLVTPELVVSSILKDALNANPSTSEISTTYIDPYNETLSKLLTPGQLEILKMAEKFLPESARQEYSNRMYSCVRRFEYFSCIKYFAWPMVKQHFKALPEFPNYQTWYPSASLYPGYPILPFPNSEGIGELPEVVEADATRQRSPRPEAVIVNILENTLRQSSNLPTSYHYQARNPEIPLAPITADQMSTFYVAQQFIPIPMRAEFMSKTMKCIRDYDYLTCTKYSTWPTIRQFQPTLPSFPDFFGWVPTFAVPELPDFSQYIPDFGSYFPQFPGFPGSKPTTTTTTTTTTTPKPDSQNTTQPEPTPKPEQQPQPIPDKPPVESADNSTSSTNLLREDQRLGDPDNSIEYRIIQILSNIRWTVLTRTSQSAVPSPIEGNLDVINSLTYNQIQILGLATSVVPQQVRGDLDARFIGCLQGGIDFLSCTRKVIWPTLQLYVRDMPNFPEEETKLPLQKNPEAMHIGNILRQPGIYQPIIGSLRQDGLKNMGSQVEGRSPITSEIVAESEESSIPIVPTQSEGQVADIDRESQESIGSPHPKAFGQSSDSSAPVISVTDTRFTPIFSDKPETVLLKILTTIQSSSKWMHPSQLVGTEYRDLSELLNPEEMRVILVSERLLPDANRMDYVHNMLGCLRTSKFIDCSRDIAWPTLVQYYPSLPNFPNFNIDEIKDDASSSLSGSTKSSIIPGLGGAQSAISETDVKTGQHGDAVVTITDTRFVPIYSQHPEAVILGILKNVQSTSPNLLVQSSSTKTSTRSSEFVSTFTDQQGNIITVSENLLPESIREVFTKRMSECVKENSFLACTRDIAWPTIAQFFPRLPNFPNIGALPEIAIEQPQQPTLLPPQLEPGASKTPIVTEDPSTAPLAPNLLPVVTEDIESRIESTLRQIATAGRYPQAKSSYLNTKDPLIVPYLNERQANVIRLTEDMLPSSVRPLFIGLMLDCSRENVFPTCVRNVGWPMLRQYAPNVPEFPDLTNFGSYFPQVPQEIPQIPQFPNQGQIPQFPSQGQIPQFPSQGQIPQFPTQAQLPQFPGQSQLSQLTNFPGFGFPGQGFGYQFRAAEDKIDRNVPSYVSEATLIGGAAHQPLGQPGSVYAPGIQGITPSVGTSRAIIDRGTSSHSSLVSGYSSEPTDLLIDAVDTPTKRRERRSLAVEPIESHQDISSDLNETPKLNITESEFLQILINATKQSGKETRGPDVYFVDKLDSKTRNSLTSEQYAILKVVEDISHQTAKAGFMSKIVQCITSLSFIRCMGIFVWPIITQNVPSLLGLPTLGSLNPFGRSMENNTFVDIFGMTKEEFERELIARKENVESMLINWYRGVVEERYDNDYGFLRVQGYGDGEIGISFNGFARKGRAKIKDHKNLPSILTIISDIMEDVLDKRETKPEHDRRKENGKRDNSKRGKSLDDYNNNVSNEPDNYAETKRSSNDDEIIAMFLDKIKSNGTNDNSGSTESNYNYLSVEDAYGAFELLFGTRLSERMAERLNDLGNNHFRILREKNSMNGSMKVDKTFANDDEDSRMIPVDFDESRNEVTEKKKIKSGLIIRLPKIDEEFVSRKITNSLISIGRKMKVQMSQLVPGITFVVSFFIQMALAHARAAASIAGMMSNMALGSAMLSMLRQSLFGPSTEPKIKYVYDNEAIGPGITWPHYNYHG